jgi:hypothetical protein
VWPYNINSSLASAIGAALVLAGCATSAEQQSDGFGDSGTVASEATAANAPG